MYCELCESRAADVDSDGAALCSPCAEALDITEHEAQFGRNVTGAASDLSLPGALFPPLGIAQMLGVPVQTPFESGQRIATEVARRARVSRAQEAIDQSKPPPVDTGVTSTDVVKVLALGVGAVAVGALGYKLFRSMFPARGAR